jgi:hypothetical protein
VRRFGSIALKAGSGVLLAASLMLTFVALVSRGISGHVFDIAISVRNPARPFTVAGIAAALLVGSSEQAARAAGRIKSLLETDRFRTLTALGAAIGVASIGIVNGSFVATAADSYGYVREAEMLSRGLLALPQEWAMNFPWPHAAGTWSPLGFRPSLDGTGIVPTYPPGYPLLMAALDVLVGSNAGYAVVPISAAMAVLATFWIGRRIEGSATGLVAALLLAASPTLLFHTNIPMSDVPATAFWTVAIALSLHRGRGSIIASGLCAGMAVLVRPNLVPLMAVPALAIASHMQSPRAERIRNVMIFGFAAFPAILLLAFLNRSWYGHPIASGYPVRELFRLDYAWTNLSSYPRWLLETQTVFVLLAPLALVTHRRERWLLGLSVVTVALSYLFYAPFDHWAYLRFLLPAFPALLILSSAVAMQFLGHLRSAAIRVLAVAILGVVALTSWQEARIRGAFANHESLERFVAIPRFVRTQLPGNAVYLTRLYSGSIREYGERLTLRWDVLDPEWLDRAVEELQRQQHEVFIVIEAQEERDLFLERFGSRSKWGKLDWVPKLEYRGIETVWIYDVRDLGRPQGEMTTRSIPNEI